MAERMQVYVCNVCGNVVEVLRGRAGELVCCGQPMQLAPEQTADQAKEKHVPVVEKAEKGFKVKVGSVPHPMEEKHYIEWIELVCSHCVCRVHLAPGQAPEAEFPGCCGEVTARENCNVHGLWKSS